MARALACDECGQIFTSRVEETATGRWSAVTVGDHRLVFAAFHVPTPEQKMASRGGKPHDLCPTCYVRKLMRGLELRPVDLFDPSEFPTASFDVST